MTNANSPLIQKFIAKARSSPYVVIHDWSLIDSDTGKPFTGKCFPMIVGRVYTLHKRIKITKTTQIDAYDDQLRVYYTMGIENPIKWRLGRPDRSYIDAYPNAVQDLQSYFSVETDLIDICDES